MTDEKDHSNKADTADIEDQGIEDTRDINIDEPTDKNIKDEPVDTTPKTVDTQKRTDKKKDKTSVEDSKRKETVEDENFHYIVRIANTDLDGHKQVIYALTQIKGIGRRMAIFIADTTGVDRYIAIGKLSDEQIEKIKYTIDNISSIAPPWMMNHRFEYDTGGNVHYISNDVAARLRDDINFMKMIRCYKGVRHELGLPVRGQRTRSNGRKGLALGVSRKATGGQKPAAQSSDKEKSKQKQPKKEKKE